MNIPEFKNQYLLNILTNIVTKLKHKFINIVISFISYLLFKLSDKMKYVATNISKLNIIKRKLGEKEIKKKKNNSKMQLI